MSLKQIKEVLMRERKRNDVGKEGFICILMVIGLTTVAMITPLQGQEAKFPSKPVEIVVPFTPGGIIDVGTRIIVDRLSRELGVPVVIRNHSGAGGLTGAVEFLNAKPDGYTMLSASAGAIISTVQLSKIPPFDPRKDLLPVGYIADSPAAMSVNKTSPFMSFDNFLQFANNNPGKLIGATTSLGGETHIMFAGIIGDTKIKTKLVPYPGSGPIFTALLGGHVDWITQSLPATMSFVRSGDARVLLLTRASSELPGIPAGPDIGLPSVSVNMWIGFLVHPQTPKSAYARLVSAVETATKDPETAKRLTDAGFNIAYRNPQGFSNLIKEQWDTLARIIKETGMKTN
jgi:tripartite-type tricarboxylate transporter receptor subunit TctC